MGINEKLQEMAETPSRREELEIAWLRGWVVGRTDSSIKRTARDPGRDEREEAADYAERVVGGSTRSGEPQVPRSLGEQSSPQRPERPETER